MKDKRYWTLEWVVGGWIVRNRKVNTPPTSVSKIIDVVPVERATEAEAKVARMEGCAKGFCREWLDDQYNYCNAPATVILWGKLLPPEALGPRCYDHAAQHIDHRALVPHTNYALFDLRPFGAPS